MQLVAGKEAISGLAAVVTHLARSSARKDALLGSTPELQAQVRHVLAVDLRHEMAKVLIWRTRSAPSPTDSLNAAAACFLQVAEWLTWASTELSPLMDDKLVKVGRRSAGCSGAGPAPYQEPRRGARV